MKVTLITPQVGIKKSGKYIRTWQMEPLPIATIAGLTPKWVNLHYYDERLESINFDEKTDLVGINVETYTAKRAYEICAEYRKRGVPTVLGGYHAMLMPYEAAKYCDAVLSGYAEGVWEDILMDVKKGKLKKIYTQPPHSKINFKLPDRSIFGKRNYLKLHCVETVRGCPFSCDFCSIAAATHSKCVLRPIDLIINEIKGLTYKSIFFVDDNIFGNLSRAEELFEKLIPLKIKWFSQGSINLVNNEKMLKLMQKSGCVGLLVGFESLQKETLKIMNKNANLAFNGEYKKAVAVFNKFGIGLYATFVFGYDTETLNDIDKTVDRAIDLKFFIAAFNHLVPFPNTPLYKRLVKEKRIIDQEWWLNPTFRYGETSFKPKNYTNRELKQACIDARRKFFSIPAILRRASNISGNLNSYYKIGAFLYTNYFLGKEVDEKAGLPLGKASKRPKPLYKLR